MSDRTDKQSLIVAGPNGAGKSTLVREFLVDYPGFYYLSADAIAARIAPTNPESAAIAAGREFLIDFERRASLGESLIVETTLSGRSSLRMFERLSELSYRVEIAFVFLPTAETCVERVKNRVRKGGHNVPEDDVLRRFQRSILNFWTLYRNMVDNWYIYYNSSIGFQKIAMGRGNDVDVIDDAVFTDFLRGMPT